MLAKRKPMKINSPRPRFADALTYAIKARGLNPRTISIAEKRKIAQVVRNTMDTTGALRK